MQVNVRKQSVFRSAIDDGKGNVNVGYLALFWAMVVWSLVSVSIVMIGGVAVSDTAREHASIIQAIGVAEGAAAFGFATVAGAIGFYLWGDAREPHGGPGPTTNVTVQQ